MNDYERFGDYQPSERSRAGTALTFLFIGLGAGALAALLFAPKTGKQMRRSLRRSYEDARETVEDWTEQAADVVERGADWANKAKDRGADWASTAKERIEPIAKKIRR
jgi:gas vesicle protein